MYPTEQSGGSPKFSQNDAAGCRAGGQHMHAEVAQSDQFSVPEDPRTPVMSKETCPFVPEHMAFLVWKVTW